MIDAENANRQGPYRRATRLCARAAVCLLLAAAAAVPPAAAGAQQEDPSGASKQQQDAARSKRLPGVTPEREAAVLTFVQQHHPELIELLTYLRKSQPRQYQKAVRELARTVERLAQIHERDMGRHDLELRAWKARSHIDLLAAQWQMQPSEPLREKLRAALVEQSRVRKLILEAERARLREKIGELDAQIKELEATQDSEVESRLRALTSASGRVDAAKARSGKNRGPGDPPGKQVPKKDGRDP